MKWLVFGVWLLASCGGGDDGDDVDPGQDAPPPTIIDPVQSTLTLDRATAPADGVTVVRVTARIVDTSGNPVLGAVVAIVATPEATVAPVPPTDAGGMTATDVTSTIARGVTISASAQIEGGAATALQMMAPVEFLHGPPAALRFAVPPPSEAIAGLNFAPAFEVVIEDVNGNLVDDAVGTIAVELASNPNFALAVGTKQVELVDGRAVFDDVRVFPIGEAYRIIAASGLVPMTSTSDAFDVVLGPISDTKSTLVLEPGTVLADGAATIAATVFLRNAGGVAHPGQPITVTLAGTGGEAFPQDGVSDFSGRFDTVLTSVVAGDKLVTVTSGNVTLTALATFLPEATCRLELPGLPQVPQPDPLSAVAIADLDGDGTLDFAVVTSTGVSVIRHRGNGRLRAPRKISFEPGDGAIAAADFDGDGHVDLAVIKVGTLKVYAGIGGAQFAAPTAITLAEPARDVITVDLDADGDVDLLVRTDNSIAIVSNLGAAFATPVVHALGTIFSQAAVVSAADVNNDGRLDVVTAAGDGVLSVLLATPAGPFTGPFTTNVGDVRGTGSLAVGDHDGDGKIDVVVPGTSGMYLARGRGDGTFTVGASLLFGGALTARAADLDLDGRLDVVATSGEAASGLVWLRGRGDGTFHPEVRYAIAGVGRAIAIADLDGDMRVDMTIAQLASSQRGMLAFLRGTGSGLDGERFVTPFLGPQRAFFAPMTGDFDGNGTLDFVATNQVTRETGVQLTALDGTPSAMSTRSVFATAATIADFDRDGRLDLAMYESGSVLWLRGDGTGGLAAPVSSTVGGGTLIRRAVAADLDGDLAQDLVLLTDTMLLVSRGNGNGTFASGVVLGVSSPEDMAVADLDHDGVLDVVASNATSFAFLRGLGTGAFAAPVSTSLAQGASGLVAGDFDGDGLRDVVVASRNGAFVSWFAGNGDGTFGPAVASSTGPLSGIRTGDFDGDGRLDAVVFAIGGIAALRGRGDGTFEAPASAALGVSATSVVIADFNADGLADVMAPQVPLDPGYALLHSRGCH